MTARKKTTGERILEGRLAIGMTQAELAKEVGVSQTTVAHWEAGKEGPWLALKKNAARSRKRLSQIAKVQRRPVEELL